MSAMGYAFLKMGFIVAKDPVNTPLADKKKAVPGVIASMVLVQFCPRSKNVVS